MNTRNQRLSFLLSYVSIVTVAGVYLFIASALVPYWQGLSGMGIQDWFAGPFTRFAYMMILVHLMSIGTTIWAFLLHRRSEQPLGMLWLVALVTLMICQVFNFTLFGGNYNLALQSGALDPEVALQTLDNWDFFHKVRTASVCVSAIVMSVIFMRATRQSAGAG
ncbi:MAG: hypothetical protein AAFZ99_19930 [Pseudomonadota bacterium]